MLIVGAFLGGFIVLLDLKLTLNIYGHIIQIGGEGYSPELKGVVVQSMLITGFSAVVAFWLGTTKQGQDQAKSVNKIAESAAPATALAVAASRAEPAASVTVLSAADARNILIARGMTAEEAAKLSDVEAVRSALVVPEVKP